ncbi:MAG TPA: hypothetical protein VM736_12210 [Gemmatimonadales bacterium]|nr:hypothetical protein [Gemmatimonadales bacterium]
MTVRILLLEDVPSDAAFVELELRKIGLDYPARRVVTRLDFQQREIQNRTDLIFRECWPHSPVSKPPVASRVQTP